MILASSRTWADIIPHPGLRVLFFICAGSLALAWLLLLIDHIKTRIALAVLDGKSTFLAAVFVAIPHLLLASFAATITLADLGMVHPGVFIGLLVVLIPYAVQNTRRDAERKAAATGSSLPTGTVTYLHHLLDTMPRLWEYVLWPIRSPVKRLLGRIPREVGGRPWPAVVAVTAGSAFTVAGLVVAPPLFTPLVTRYPTDLMRSTLVAIPVLSGLAFVQAVALLVQVRWAVASFYLWLASLAVAAWTYLPLLALAGIPRPLSSAVLPLIVSIALAQWAQAFQRGAPEPRAR